MAYNPLNPNGQDTMSDSQPVVIASDQSAVPVSSADLTTLAGAVAGTEMQVDLVSNQPDSIATGTIVANGETVVAAVVDGMAGFTMGYYGTYSTGASLVMEASPDGGSTYVTLRMLGSTTSTLGYVVTIAAGVNGSAFFTADIPSGATHLRVRCSAWAAPTGTINVSIGQSAERNGTPPGAIVLTSGTVTTVSTVTNITNQGHLADNAAFTDGTTRVMMAGYTYDETPGTALTENDGAAARINVNRAQVHAIEDGVTRGRYATVSAAGAQSVDGGTATHDAADAGAPIKVGGRAVNAEITAVANNDRTDFVADLTGKQIVLPYANPENMLTGTITTAMTGTTSTAVSGMGAPGAGLRNYITTVIMSNSHATVGTDIVLQDGNGGTTIGTFPAAALYGGCAITLPTPIRQPTTNTALYAANVTTGASTKVTCYGYKGA